jgi:hypothetical protein
MDNWKAKITANNTRVASGQGRTMDEALSNLEKTLKNRRDGYPKSRRSRK